MVAAAWRLAWMESAERIRDVLPLPTGDELRSVFFGALAVTGPSQSQQRRQRRKEARFATLEAGILALIELGGQGGPVPCLGQTTGHSAVLLPI